MTTRAAWGLWAVAMVVTLSAIVLVVITRSVPRGPYDQWDLAVLRDVGFLSYLTVGLIIAAKRAPATRSAGYYYSSASSSA